MRSWLTRRGTCYPWFGVVLCLAGCAHLGPDNTAQLSTQIRQADKAVSPGIVHLAVEGGTLSASRRAKILEEYRKENPFDIFGDVRLEQSLLGTQLPPASGSGMVFNSDGVIVTCYHLIEGRTSIRVTLADGREDAAKVVAIDPDTDIAVLRVGLKGLEPVVFKDSGDVAVGDWVICVGAPFGLTHTVTHGIVSFVGRENLGGGVAKYQDFIQTDAPVHPGCSGGALLLPSGRVIGMVTAAAPLNEAMSAGIGFAIPSQRVIKSVHELLNKGRVERVWLGIAPHEMTRLDCDVLGVKEGSGVLVVGLESEGPASVGGVLPEDCIVAVEHTPIRAVNELENRLANCAAGQTVLVDVVHETRRISRKVRLATCPTYPDTTKMGGGCMVLELGISASTAVSGMRKQTTFIRPRSGFGPVETREEDVRGVIVRTVDGPFAAILKTGDWLEEANGKPIRSVLDLRKVIAEMRAGEDLHLKADRGTQKLVELTVPASVLSHGQATPEALR